MIVVMKTGASRAQVSNVVARIEQSGCTAHLSEGEERTIIGIIGNGRPLDHEQIERMSGVERTVPILRPFKLASREFHPHDTVVTINGCAIGGEQLIVMAGPCAIESREQLGNAAEAVKEAGAHVLRGGAFKPRTSPYSFQGLGEEGLRILADVRQDVDLPAVTEVTAPELVPLVTTFANILNPKHLGNKPIYVFSFFCQVALRNYSRE